MRPKYVPSWWLDKTNPPSFLKRWRYAVPLPRPFMSFCQCVSIINTDMCVEFHENLSMLSAPNHRKRIFKLTRCHGNSILDINIPSTVLHGPCFDIILMKFETNRVKVNAEFKAFWKWHTSPAARWWHYNFDFW